MSKLKGTILVVDDDEDVLITSKMILSEKFTDIITLNRPDQIISTLRKNPTDVILLDMNFKQGQIDGNEGIFWLREILKDDPNAHVVMQTAYGDINVAVDSIKIGAIDFLVKPWDTEKLLTTTVNTYKLKQSTKEISKLKNQKDQLTRDLKDRMGEIIYRSDEMKSILETISKVGPTDANILVLGENGTGKELVARQLHLESERKDEAFVKVDLGAIPENLAESQLFGHKRGAFTDAKNDHTGYFEKANNGTLFLDEIGNASPSLQSKLLSAIQYGQINKIGDDKPIVVNTRVICATNKSLIEMIEEGVFRQDLLYRINTVEIRIPPLRERQDDIKILIEHFQKKFTAKYDKKFIPLENDCIISLENYPWPGNIRELEHATERAVIMSDSGILTKTDFLPASNEESQIQSNKSLNIEEIEKNTILKAIEKSEGNMSEVARILGFGRSTLYRKLKKYGIE